MSKSGRYSQVRGGAVGPIISRHYQTSLLIRTANHIRLARLVWQSSPGRTRFIRVYSFTRNIEQKDYSARLSLNSLTTRITQRHSSSG